MRYVVVGAGAIGGAVSAALARAGKQVTLVGRERHAAAMRDGLTVLRPGSRETVPVDVAVTPDDVPLESGDVLLVAVKSHDMAQVLDTWRGAPVHGPDGSVMGAAADLVPLVCLQNGVENERLAQRFFRRVVGACIYIPSQAVAPGVVALPAETGIGAIEVGRYPTGSDEACERLAADLTEGGILSRTSQDVMRLKYYKLVTNVQNIVFALFPSGAETDAVAKAVQAEAQAVFSAAGVDFAGMEAEQARITPLTRIGRIDGVELVGNSTAQSLASGAGSVETDYLNGEVILQGVLVGVETPYNRALQDLAYRVATDRRAPGSVAVAELEEALLRPSR